MAFSSDQLLCWSISQKSRSPSGAERGTLESQQMESMILSPNERCTSSRPSWVLCKGGLCDAVIKGVLTCDAKTSRMHTLKQGLLFFWLPCE